MNVKLAAKLREMLKQDQEAVKRWQREGIDSTSLIKKQTQLIKSLLADYGWPTVSMVGSEASKSAWLLVQHSDHDVRFQKKTLALMQRAYRKNKKDVLAMYVAFLTDRIRVNEKKPQKFGTQFRTDKNGRLVLWPVRDIKNVDRRRAAYGIEPLEQYIRDAKKFRLAQRKGKQGK